MLDTFNIDQWVGADVWITMVRKAMDGLKFTAHHKDDLDFWSKKVRHLANQYLMVIVFLNTCLGRCGGWEKFLQSEMQEQVARQNHKNVFTFAKHKTFKWHGPLKKWVPNSVIMALRLLSALPLGESQLFVTPHTSVKQVTVSILLQKASATLAHPKAVPNTNFIRKLYATPMEAGETVEQSGSQCCDGNVAVRQCF